LRDALAGRFSHIFFGIRLDHRIFMLGSDRFETRRKQVWNRAEFMDVGNGEVGFWFDDGNGAVVDVD
jgi:hypothetical protein